MSPNRYFHLAGIIPVSGQMTDFQLDWEDCLMPLAPDYTAIERSVMECAYAGCETIWIVANDDVSPLIKNRVGEYVQDPSYFGKRPGRRSRANQRRIPIFYIPISMKDYGKRDCLSWSIIHGSLTAFKISVKMSQWLKPDRYYVSFPFGVYGPECLKPYRKDISSHTPFALSYKGQTVADGLYLGFTFDKEDFLNFRRVIRTGTGMFTANNLRDGKYPTEKLPFAERYSARFFDIAKVLKDVRLEKVEEVPWYYSMDSWQGYCDFIGSEHRETLERPPKFLLDYKQWNLIGDNNE